VRAGRGATRRVQPAPSSDELGSEKQS
jgi:hypothetical protein